ncbi:hypothetical protein ACSBR2_033517 [Camellia fascicularis]
MARKVTTDAKPPSLEKKGLLKEALKGDGAKIYRSWLTYFQKAEGDGAKFYNSWLAYFRKTKDWLEDDTIIKRQAVLITVAAGWLGAIACLFDYLRRDSQELEKRNDVLKLVDRATAWSKLFSILALSQLSLGNAKLNTLVGTAKLILNAIVVFASLVIIYITYKICSN